jgi:hypothetical protein
MAECNEENNKQRCKGDMKRSVAKRVSQRRQKMKAKEGINI